MADSPNVLLIMSDQHRADVLGCEGRTDLATPQLDTLATQGAHFKRAYCNNAVCAASRNSMQTGLYPRTLGIGHFEPIGYEGTLVSLQQWLAGHGYRTGAFGKRHLDKRVDTHWHASATTLPKHEPSDKNWWQWIAKQKLEEAAQRDWQAEFGKATGAAPMGSLISNLPDHATMEAWTADRALDFIRHQHAEDQPFFAFCSFYRPHQPYTPTRHWFDQIDPEKIKLPATINEPVEHLPPALQGIRKKMNNPWCCGRAAENPELYRFYIRCYLALVAEIDHHVGRLLNELDKLGLTDDTIVIYASDHGDFVAAHGMVEKCAIGHNVYEQTLRVPLMVRWPGHVHPGPRDDLVELVDLYPTLADLLGLPKPTGVALAGRSLGDCLRQGRPLGREFAFSENGSQITAIGKHSKLGHWIEPMNPKWDWRAFGDMLFDRKRDPHETSNLFDAPEASQAQAQLLKAIDGFVKSTPAAAWNRAAAQKRN